MATRTNDHKCDGFINNCDGLVFPRDAENRLAVIQRREDELKQNALAERSKAQQPLSNKITAEEQVNSGPATTSVVPLVTQKSADPTLPTRSESTANEAGTISAPLAVPSVTDKKPQPSTQSKSMVEPSNEGKSSSGGSEKPSQPSAMAGQKTASSSPVTKSSAARSDTLVESRKERVIDPAKTTQAATLPTEESKQKLPQPLSVDPVVPNSRLAANKPSSQMPAKIGKWQIKKDVDQMTDKISCTAFYETNSQIQLVNDGFFISLRGRGGVKGITLGFGDKPPRSLRLPANMEKQISAVIFTNDEFEEFQSSRRLRVQVLTVLDSIWQADIDLAGHVDALEILRGPQCR